MRALIWVSIAIALVNSAPAQVRLPGAQLPVLPTQKLTQAIGQTGTDTLDQLSGLRHLQIARLIRANPRTIATDPHGNPIVRDELLAFSPSASAMEAARALGFGVVREQTIEDLDIRLVVLRPPAKVSIAKALGQLREADPAGSYDFNHIYTGGGGVASGPAVSPASVAASGPAVSPASVAASAPAAPPASAPVAVAAAVAGTPPENAGATGRDRAAPRVGLIDAGVDVAHPVFHDAVIHPWGCADRVLASAHGTGVASLLIGQATGFHGVLPRGELYAANVYCDAPTGGAVDALAAAFAWLAQQRVAVINVSLVGPDNLGLALIVRALTSRGYLLVAAVGNDGPAAPPLYPASYPGVIGVTGVDKHRRALLEAARGKQVMFAAPGADMLAADSGGKYSAVRGTSFAAPIVAALLAQTVSAPDSSARDAAVEALARQAIDLGPPGRDLTYGFGLVGAEYAMEEMPVSGRINR
jgi:subtilisin family serine protease